MKTLVAIVFTTFWTSLNAFGQSGPLPGAPTDPAHPGSKVYAYKTKTLKVTCQGRAVDIVHPVPTTSDETFPVVIYGHGQMIGFDSYQRTLEHLAGKGIIGLHPTYDTGFFDQEWTRMGRDYTTMSACALASLSSSGVKADLSQVIFSGHSKGAYVASVAAGLAVSERLAIQPAAMVFFQLAGYDAKAVANYPESAPLTVVFSDRDTVVKRALSDDVYRLAKSRTKQYLLVTSYTTTTPRLEASHFWPLTKSSTVGGGPEGALHYHSSWKWLVGAAMDLKSGGQRSNPYVYGALTTDKGVSGLNDEVVSRSF